MNALCSIKNVVEINDFASLSLFKNRSLSKEKDMPQCRKV